MEKQRTVERFGDIEVVVKQAGKEYHIEYGPYIIGVSHPYAAGMAIFALMNVERDLFEKGWVEKVIDWQDEYWTKWDPYRVFGKADFSIFHKDGHVIDLEVRMIYSPAESRFKVYVRGFLGAYIPLE